MGFFNKKRRTGLSDAQEQKARRMADRFLSGQRWLADRINLRIRQWPLSVQLGCLVCFGTAFGCYCAYLLFKVFF